jgi:AraC-like DNA-binding protein
VAPAAQNAARYWLDPATDGLSLLSADFTTHEYPTHIHEALLIAVTEHGGSEITAGAGPDEFHSQALLVVNPTEPHSSRMNYSHRWLYRSFYLEEAALEHVMLGLGIDDLPSFSRNIIHDRDLVSDFLRLHRALDGPSGDHLRQSELLVSSFGRLVRRHGGSGGRPAAAPRDQVLLRLVMELMRGRYAERLTLAALASAAGLTQFQLIGLFRRGVGMTPHAYLTQVRLGAARRGLAAGLPIALAASTAGFYDQAALTSCFRRSLGITPLQFARNFRQDRARPRARSSPPSSPREPSTTSTPTC